MEAVITEWPRIGQAFLVSLRLFLLSAVGAYLIGNLLALMMLAPVAPVRLAAAAYIRLVRNTPLTVVFFLIVFGLPQVGILMPFFHFAVVALSLYTATFVAEVLRSGFESVPTGQGEAARSLGMGFLQTFGLVVLPQATRNVVPPMVSVLIALFKNTSVASAFGVVEAMGTMTSLVNAYSSAVLWIMATIGLTYIGIAWLLGVFGEWIEGKLVVHR